MQIELTSEERQIILMALVHKCIKMSIMEPATPRAIRDMYKNLIEKLKSDEILHRELEKTVGGRLLVPTGTVKKCITKIPS